MADSILIEKLELQTRIGVTAEERAQLQRVTVSLVIEPRRGFSALGDRLENAVDYVHLHLAVKEIAASRERNLIETLAEEIAAGLFARFPLRAVEVEARKFVLHETESIGVKIRREA